MAEKHLYIAKPTGFCGGVRRAIEQFEKLAVQHSGSSIYVLHELVHNATVTQHMREEGAVFVDALADIPEGSISFLGAHGVVRETVAEARRRHLDIHDATCPLVAKIQRTAAENHPGLPLIFMGDGRHPEVKSILDRANERRIFVISNLPDIQTLPPLEAALFLCQTTLDAEDVSTVGKVLRERVPGLVDASHVCESVLARQLAVRQLADICERIYVIGSAHSANARSLLKASQSGKAEAKLIGCAEDLALEDLPKVSNLGLASATSAPDGMVEEIVQTLENAGFKP